MSVYCIKYYIFLGSMKGWFFRLCTKIMMPTLCYVLLLSCICYCTIGLHKHTEWSQCRVTIVYSFHCTIWWLALLCPPPLLYHFLSLFIFPSLTVSLVAELHSTLRNELVTLQMWGWLERLALLCQQYSSDCLSWTMKKQNKTSAVAELHLIKNENNVKIKREKAQILGDQKLQHNRFGV